MPETDADFAEARREECSGPGPEQTSDVWRRRKAPSRPEDLSKSQGVGRPLHLLERCALDSVAVRAAVVPVEELGMEELLPLARPGGSGPRHQDALRFVPEMDVAPALPDGDEAKASTTL